MSDDNEAKVCFIQAGDIVFGEGFTKRCLLMRADRLIRPWVDEVRSTFGESQVVKVLGGVNTQWAVPWGHHEVALRICGRHFTDIIVERASVLGHPAFTDEEQVHVANIVENLTVPGEKENVDCAEKLIDEVLEIRGMEASGVDCTTITLSNRAVKLEYHADVAEARRFGSMLYKKVRLIVVPIEDEETSE